MDGFNLGPNADEHVVTVPIGPALILVLLYLCIFARYEVLSGQHSTVTSLIGMSMMLTLGAFIVLIAFAHYVESLEMVSRKKVANFSILIIGFLSANVPVFYEFFMYRDMPIVILLCMLSALFYTHGKILLKSLAEHIPLREMDIKNLYKCYPPVKRSDLVLLDFFIVVLLLLPFLAKLLH